MATRSICGHGCKKESEGDMALTLRDAQGLTLTDEAAELASPQDRQALRNIAIGGTSQFGRGWESAGLGERANELFTQAAQMYNSGRVQEGDVLKAQAQDFQQQASQWAPTVQSASDVNSISSAADWMMGAAGNVRSSVRPALGGLAGAAIGAVATPLTGGMINPLTGAKIGGAIGAAWPTFNMEKQESVAEAMNDPEVMARNSHDDILNAGNVKGAVNTGIELLGGAPVSVMGRLLKAPVQAAAKEGFKAGVKEAGKALAKEAGGEFLTEGAQSLTGQATQNYLKGDQLSNLDYGQAFDEGAAGAVAGGLMSGVGSAGSLMKSAVGKGADVARNIADDPVGAASSAIADAGGVAGKYGATAVGVLERMISSPHRAHETLVAGTGASPGEYHVAAQEYATHVMQNKGYSEQEKKDAAQFVTDMVKDPEGATRRYRDKLTVKHHDEKDAAAEQRLVEELSTHLGETKPSLMRAKLEPVKQEMDRQKAEAFWQNGGGLSAERPRWRTVTDDTGNTSTVYFDAAEGGGRVIDDYGMAVSKTGGAVVDRWLQEATANKWLRVFDKAADAHARRGVDQTRKEMADGLFNWVSNGFADKGGNLFVPDSLLQRFGKNSAAVIDSLVRTAASGDAPLVKLTPKFFEALKWAQDEAALKLTNMQETHAAVRNAIPELVRGQWSDEGIRELTDTLRQVAKHGASARQEAVLLRVFGSKEAIQQALEALPEEKSPYGTSKVDLEGPSSTPKGEGADGAHYDDFDGGDYSQQIDSLDGENANEVELARQGISTHDSAPRYRGVDEDFTPYDIENTTHAAALAQVKQGKHSTESLVGIWDRLKQEFSGDTDPGEATLLREAERAILDEFGAQYIYSEKLKTAMEHYGVSAGELIDEMQPGPRNAILSKINKRYKYIRESSLNEARAKDEIATDEWQSFEESYDPRGERGTMTYGTLYIRRVKEDGSILKTPFVTSAFKLLKHSWASAEGDHVTTGEGALGHYQNVMRSLGALMAVVPGARLIGYKREAGGSEKITWVNATEVSKQLKNTGSVSVVGGMLPDDFTLTFKEEGVKGDKKLKVISTVGDARRQAMVELYRGDPTHELVELATTAKGMYRALMKLATKNTTDPKFAAYVLSVLSPTEKRGGKVVEKNKGDLQKEVMDLYRELRSSIGEWGENYGTELSGAPQGSNFEREQRRGKNVTQKGTREGVAPLQKTTLGEMHKPVERQRGSPNAEYAIRKYGGPWRTPLVDRATWETIVKYNQKIEDESTWNDDVTQGDADRLTNRMVAGTTRAEDPLVKGGDATIHRDDTGRILGGAPEARVEGGFLTRGTAPAKSKYTGGADKGDKLPPDVSVSSSPRKPRTYKVDEAGKLVAQGDGKETLEKMVGTATKPVHQRFESLDNLSQTPEQIKAQVELEQSKDWVVDQLLKHGVPGFMQKFRALESVEGGEKRLKTVNRALNGDTREKTVLGTDDGEGGMRKTVEVFPGLKEIGTKHLAGVYLKGTAPLSKEEAVDLKARIDNAAKLVKDYIALRKDNEGGDGGGQKTGERYLASERSGSGAERSAEGGPAATELKRLPGGQVGEGVNHADAAGVRPTSTQGAPHTGTPETGVVERSVGGRSESQDRRGVEGQGLAGGSPLTAPSTTTLDKLRAYLPLAAQSNVPLSNAIKKDISRLEKGFGANQKTTELLKAAEKQFGKPWETAGEAPKVEAAPTSLEDAVNKAAPPNFAREKELAKAKGADFVFAPEGVAGSFASRLAAAAKAMGKLVDPNGKEDLRDNVVYVSVPGAGRGFTGIQQLINDVQKLMNRGAIIRTDNKQHASTAHNADGEGKLRTALAFSVVGGTIKEGALYTDWQKPQVARKAEAKPTSTFTADNFDTMLEKEDYGKLSTMDDLLAFARHTHARFVELDKVFNKEGEFANQRDELIYSSVDNLREDALDWLSPNSAAVQDFETWVHEALERKPTEGEVESFVRALAGREKASMEGVSETPMLSVSSDGVIKAVTFKTKGVVAINRSVYDKMSEQEKHALALHEIGVHYGMKRILGNEQYESVMAQLRALKGKSKLVDAAYKAVPESTHAMHVDEEAMAYLVEQRANLPVVTRLLKAVKTWFKETFGTTRAADEVFADDMVQIAESALRRYSNRVRQISVSNLSNTPKEGFVKLDFQKALNSDPFAHKLVDTITDNFDGKAMLTGSIAMSPQIDIYRDSGNQVHDLDFVYNGSMEELDATVYDTFKNAHRLRDIVNSDYTTRSFWISKDGRRVSKAVEGEKRGEVHLFDEQGNPIPADAGLAVDFFVGKGAATPTTQHTYRGADGRSRTIPLQHAAATMDAKFKMGREKDLNDALLAGSGDPVFSVGEKKASMMGAGAGIIVDGVAHPRENADGRAIYPTDAGIRNFWRWVNDLRQRRLAQATGADKNQGRNGQDAGRAARSGGGDGPLFDMEGRPKVLYHGTNADIEAFDLNHPDKWDNGWLGKGVYLSNDPDMANFYATQKGGASNVMPVYAALSNPYQFTADQKRKLSRASKEVVDSFTKGAIAKGYDGGILDHGNGTFEVVVFDPSAVKSATGNNGGFSAKDARVSLSEQNARTDGKPLTEEQIVAQVTAAMNEIHRMFGDTVKPEFKTAFGDNRSGEWEPNAEKNIIRLALNGDVMSTLFHESIHEFFDMLKKHGNLNTRDLLKRVADAPVLNRRIERLLHEHPAAQQQVHNNPEEAAAFLYQFWRTGQITLGGEINTFFKKVKHFLNRVLGLVSETARKSWMDKQQRYVDEMMVDRLFQTLTEGKLQSVNGDTTMRDAAMAAIKKDAEAHEKMLDNLDKAGRDFIRTAGKLFFSAEAMLRATRNPYMVEIAKAFNQSAGEAMETSDTLRAKQSLFDGLDQQRGIWIGKLDSILRGYEKEDLELARQALSTKIEPTDRIVRGIVYKIRDFNDQMFKYITKRDVRRLDEKGKWVPVEKRADYFTRVWDLDALRDNAGKFREMLFKHHTQELTAIAEQASGELARHLLDEGDKAKYKAMGDAARKAAHEGQTNVTPEMVADAIIERLLTNSYVDIAESESNVGLSPVATSVNRRELSWISDEHFDEFKSKDLVGIMTAYTASMVKRAEYTRVFGHGSEKLTQGVDKAKLHEMGGDTLIVQAVASLSGAIEQWKKKKAAAIEDGVEFNEPFPTLMGEGMKVFTASVGEEKARADLARAVKTLEQGVKAIMGMEGTLGRNASAPLRALNSTLLSYQNIRLSPGVLFSSFPDMMGIVVNGGELKDAWNALVAGMREIRRTWKHEKGDDLATQRAEAWGTVDPGSFLNTIGQTYGSMWMTDKMRRFNETFFRLNGMEGWNRGTRIYATEVAERVILDYQKNGYDKSDKAAVARFETLFGKNFDPAHIAVDANGDLDLNNHNNQAAVLRWVNSAIIKPNAAHRTIWGSDTRMAAFWQYKQFSYSFHRVMIKAAVEQARLGNLRPAMVLAVGYAPIAIAAGAVKEMLVPGEEPPWMQGGLDDYLGYGLSRSGIFGVPGMGYDALWSYNGPVQGAIEGLGGPTVGQLLGGFTDPVEKSLLGAMPAGGWLRRAA